MKKVLILTLTLTLLCAFAASALTGQGYPSATGEIVNRAEGTIDGQSISLAFDAGYTYVADGVATVCFFCYDADQRNYLEFYLNIPADAKPGDSFGDDTAAGVMFYEVHEDKSEDFFYSYHGYPAGSTMRITVDAVASSGDTLAYSGTVNATLVLDRGDAQGATIDISDLRYDFSYEIPGSDPRTRPSEQPPMPEATPVPDLPLLPESTEDIPAFVPKFTLPPHYAKL